MADRKKLDDPSRTEAYDPELDVNNRGYKPSPAAPAPRSSEGSRFSLPGRDVIKGGLPPDTTVYGRKEMSPDDSFRGRKESSLSYNKGGKIGKVGAGGMTVHNYCAGGKVISSKKY